MEKITQYLIQSTVQGSEVRAWEEGYHASYL